MEFSSFNGINHGEYNVSVLWRHQKYLRPGYRPMHTYFELSLLHILEFYQITPFNTDNHPALNDGISEMFYLITLNEVAVYTCQTLS